MSLLSDRPMLIAAGIGIGLGLLWLALGGIGWALVGFSLPWILIAYAIGGRWAEMGLVVLLAGGVPLPFLAIAAVDSGLARDDLIGHQPFLVLGVAAVLALVGLATLVAVGIGGRGYARRASRPPHEG